MYVFVQPATGLRRGAALALKDVVALFVGATALVVALGLYARANGGPFLFFEAQIDFIRSGSSARSSSRGTSGFAASRACSSRSFSSSSRLLFSRRAPAAAVSICRRLGRGVGVPHRGHLRLGVLRRRKRSRVPYYFSYFSISIALTMASVAALAVSLVRSRGRRRSESHCGNGRGGGRARTHLPRRAPEWTGRTGMRSPSWSWCVAAAAGSRHVWRAHADRHRRRPSSRRARSRSHLISRSTAAREHS